MTVNIVSVELRKLSSGRSSAHVDGVEIARASFHPQHATARRLKTAGVSEGASVHFSTEGRPVRYVRLDALLREAAAA